MPSISELPPPSANTSTTRIDYFLQKSGYSNGNGHPLLSRRIAFKQATDQHGLSMHQDRLKKKYEVINRPPVVSNNNNDAPISNFKNADSSKNSNSSQLPIRPSNTKQDSETPMASVVIYDKRQLSFAWNFVRQIGPGLENLGNTCFLNSVLQCLTYTPPLADYLLSKSHSSSCRNKSKCLLCEFQTHVSICLGDSKDSSKYSKRVIAPDNIVGRLKTIAKHMRLGRQEDAHEFTRYFIDALVKPGLVGYERADPVSKQTTAMHQIFGGYLRSQVECMSCHGKSNTFDPLLDLSLEIRNCNTLQKALAHFTKAEMLVKDNQYKCEKCKKKSNAKKQITIAQPPTVLTIQLKRFDFTFSSRGDKLSKAVDFEETIDIAPYTSFSKSEIMYDLYAVLVHAGSTCFSGHYYCYVKNSNGIWYCMNDSDVYQVSLQQVLKQKGAYMLFYNQRADTKSREPKKINPVSITTCLPNHSLAQPDRSPTVPLSVNITGNTPASQFKSSAGVGARVESSRPFLIFSPPKVSLSLKTAMATSKIDNHSKIVQEILLESQQLPKATSKPYLPSATSTFSVNKTGWSVKELTPNDVKTEEKNRMDNKGWVIKQVGSDFDSINCNSTNIFTSISAWKAQENNVYDVKVGLWDSVTAGSGIFRDRVLQECRESSKRKRPNKEDLEYDRGRLKKVRKNKASNWTVRLLNSR